MVAGYTGSSKTSRFILGSLSSVQEHTNHKIVPMTVAYVNAVASIHYRELPSSVLSRLGIYFLRDFYYRGLISVQEFRGFVLIWEGRVAGFIAISLDPAGIFKNLLLNESWALVKSLVRSFFKDIRVFRAIFQAFRYFLSEKPPANSEHSEILSFAVPAEFRTQKFYKIAQLKPGNVLFRFALEFLKKSNKKNTFLMVESQNVSARIFYKNMGMKETCIQSYFGLECLKCELTFGDA